MPLDVARFVGQSLTASRNREEYHEGRERASQKTSCGEAVKSSAHQGMSRSALARKLGISRRSVYHWIETGQLDRELSRSGSAALERSEWRTQDAGAPRPLRGQLMRDLAG